MRKINWDEKLSEEDIAWLRQTGMVDVEDRIQRHQEQFDASVPELEETEDTVTRSALDPTAGADSFVDLGNGPQKVDPTAADPQDDDVLTDDYDTWSKPELEAELTARNAMKEAGNVEVHGTGKNGAILKEDLVKGLRLWDQENPDALAE